MSLSLPGVRRSRRARAVPVPGRRCHAVLRGRKASSYPPPQSRLSHEWEWGPQMCCGLAASQLAGSRIQTASGKPSMATMAPDASDAGIPTRRKSLGVR